MARVLVVDDEQSVQQILKSFLEIDGHHVVTANNYDDAISFLDHSSTDLIVTDVYLGKKTGLEVLNTVNETQPNTPVIVITGQPNLDTAASCVRAGAFDLLQKPIDQSNFIDATRRAIKESRRRRKVGELTLENRRHRKELGQTVERQTIEIERATKALIKSEQRYRTLVSAVPEILLEFDRNHKCIWYNDVAIRFFGDSIYNRELTELCVISSEEESFNQKVSSMSKSSQGFVQLKCHTLRKDREERWISWTIKPLYKVSGDYYGLLATARDITEMARLEEQVRQKAKLETIGQLAGGVAHDFNNILGAILAQSNLLGLLGASTPTSKQAIEIIENGVFRAKELTDKLLGFAQCGKTKNTPLDVHSIIEEVTSLLKRTLDKRIDISTFLRADNSVIFGDPSQIYQVILNLTINARDAIKHKFSDQPTPLMAGEIKIETTLIQGSDLTSNHSKDKYLRIYVTDNGTGISKDIRERIFEPFFTTKKSSGNSGMGLAMVYGIINNHEGFINLKSSLCYGTSFFIDLPLAERSTKVESILKNPEITIGKGNILLIDDEDLVRSSLSALLRSIGYQTFCAASGDEALAVYQEVLADIDLVILDLMMPGVDVSTCIKRLKASKPNLKILLTSGYGLNEKAESLMNGDADGFIQKPCGIAELSQLISSKIIN